MIGLPPEQGGDMPKLDRSVALLLEEQALIALDIEGLLQKAGFEEVVALASCAAAAAWLGDQTPDLAVIETRLRDGFSGPIAEILSERGIPFIVHSADADCAGNYSQMSHHFKWITKPCDPDEFLAAVEDCCGP